MTKHRRLTGLLVFLLYAGAAEVDPADEPMEAASDYRIGPDDVIQVSVWKNEAMSRSVVVRPDGRISLPLLNDVVAAGLSPMQLRERLKERLADYLPSPEVSVMVSEVRSLKVSVLGEVNKPGRYELKSWCTVADVLAMAGGLSAYADRSGILVLRSNGGAPKRIPFNYARLTSAPLGQANFRVLPDDIVLVP